MNLGSENRAIGDRKIANKGNGKQLLGRQLILLFGYELWLKGEYVT